MPADERGLQDLLGDLRCLHDESLLVPKDTREGLREDFLVASAEAGERCCHRRR